GETAIYVVDDKGAVHLQTSFPTDGEAIMQVLKPFLARLRRVGHEVGSLSPWLHPELVKRGLPAAGAPARQVHVFFTKNARSGGLNDEGHRHALGARLRCFSLIHNRPAEILSRESPPEIPFWRQWIIRWPRGNPQARSRPIVEGCMADGSFHCGALRQLSSNIAMPEAGVVHPIAFVSSPLFRGDLRRHAEDCLRLQEFGKGMVAPFAAVA